MTREQTDRLLHAIAEYDRRYNPRQGDPNRLLLKDVAKAHNFTWRTLRNALEIRDDLKGDEFKDGLTIGEVIQRGWIECPKCSAQRPVGNEGLARGSVASCEKCGDSGYWNLFVETL